MQENKKHRWFGIPSLLPFIKPYRKTIIAMIVLGILSSLADTLYPLFNQYALDQFIAKRNLEGLGGFIALYLGLMVLQEIDNYYCLYQCGKIEMTIGRDLRGAAFDHLQTLSFSFFNQNNVGYLHSRVMSDTAKIGELIAWRMMDVVWNVSYILFVFSVMFSINLRLAFLILLLVPIAVLFILYFQKKLVTLNGRIRELNAQITGNFNEGITGVRSIKSLAIEEKIFDEFDTATRRMYRTTVKTAHHSSLFLTMITLLSSMVLALVLWQGGIITIDGVIQIGTLSVFMSYAVGILEPVQNIITTFSNLIAIQINIERLMKLLAEQSDVRDTEAVREKYGDTFYPKKENWEPFKGDILFEHVDFHYPDGDETVLSDFTLHVPAGTNVAIVGETGSGKSTLVNLVCRFYEPTGGRILIDGKDAKERSAHWLHSNIGYVLQTPHLFSGTIRENLKYGNPEATDEEIQEALHLMSADFVLNGMEKGLDTEVGEGGDRLSTGEKQLLSFTRALLADPRILILDEATASIDTVTEKKIQDAIHTVIQGRTSFVIAHRLSTIVNADVILAVQGGKIVEQGTHMELMQKQGYYYRLYMQQLQVGSTQSAFSRNS